MKTSVEGAGRWPTVNVAALMVMGDGMNFLKKVVEPASGVSGSAVGNAPRMKADPIVATIEEDSVLAGAEYSAVLHLTVPLRFLLKDGTVSQDPSAVPESEWEYGGWVPRAKSWREMGIDLDEMPETTQATDIGPMLRSQYLPFLKAVRAAVESEGTVNDRIDSLRGVLGDKAFAGFVRKHGGQGKIVDVFFPPLVQSIPWINSTVATSLTAARITTVRQLRKKTEKELLAIKGVGRGALQAAGFRGRLRCR